MNLKITYLFLVFCLPFIGNAQTAAETTPENKTRIIDVYRDVDVMATYRGGYGTVLGKIESATRNCKRGKFKGKDAAVVIDILVSDKGKVVKVDFVKAPTDLCNDDIRKTIEATNQWIPAKVNGKPVYSYVTLTVNLINEGR